MYYKKAYQQLVSSETSANQLSPFYFTIKFILLNFRFLISAPPLSRCLCISLSVAGATAVLRLRRRTCIHRISLSILTVILQLNLVQPVFTEAKDDGCGGDNWTTGAISCAKLQSNHHHQQTNNQFFTGQMSFLSPNQQCQSTEGKISHFMDLPTPSSPESSNFVSDHQQLLVALGEGCHASHQPSDDSPPARM